MTTIKSYTDLEQSKKLAEFLPIESADHFHIIGHLHTDGPRYEVIRPRNEIVETDKYWPCWSLSALLAILRDYTLQTNTDGTVFVVCDSKKPMISDAYDNPVDAFVAMIECLHELNLL